jgi:hypothetical protein
MSKQRHFYMGVDLGQAQDFTAITIAERLYERREIPPSNDYEAAKLHFGDPLPVKTTAIYRVGHLERMPLGTPYPAQVDRIKERFTELRGPRIVTGEGSHHENRVDLIVDATGVGRPVVDMLKQSGLRVVPVVITGGDSETRSDGFYRIPKRNLVSAGQVLLQTKRLHVHPSLQLVDTLLKELQAFKVTITNRGHDTYGNDWRENDHDDLVLSTLLAVWWPERRPQRSPVQIPEGWR